MIEVWKDIRGYEGEYQVSNLGRVRSLDRIEIITDSLGRQYKRVLKGKLLSPNDNGSGYLTVQLGRKGGRHYIHRLVAEHFVDNPLSLPEINHIDNDTKNNTADNLEWVTRKQNICHMVKQNRHQKGSNHYRAKLNELLVIEIKQMLKQGISEKYIASKYGVKQATINDIKHKRTWKHVV